MTRFLAVMGFVLPFFSALCAAKEETNTLQLISPLEHSIHHEEMASVVVRFTSSEVEGIIISAESNQSNEVLRQIGRNTYCKTIVLVPGANTITVKGFGKNGLEEKLSTVIYHDIVTDKIYKYPPKSFSLSTFHIAENEKKCSPCHKMEINEIKGIAFDNPSDSNCFTCHKKLTTRGQGHAPAVNWLCTSCHDKTESVSTDEGNASKEIPKFNLSASIGKECVNCHKKEREIWAEKRFRHMPVDAYQCTRCHNPHSSENRFFLKAKPWEICTSCHIDKRDGNHFISTFGKKTHPTRGKPDPSRPGKEIDCVSCHNPHASNTSFLIDAKSTMSICVKCHKK